MKLNMGQGLLLVVFGSIVIGYLFHNGIGIVAAAVWSWFVSTLVNP